ncbi:hypothetical protein [Nocardia sp. NPDC004604]|uniref:hypothetical protein n=1 Tax=Nocardia sp. NPDC004604 TaxID=3157013 RepID=UPI0033AAD301
MDVLDALMGLPIAMPIDLASLTERERHALPRIPDGTVDESAGTIVRRVVAPLIVDFALVPARNWKTGLRKAGAFAPFCARAITWRPCPPDLDDTMMQATFSGIGTYTGHTATTPGN